jgi:hypothetical protein
VATIEECQHALERLSQTITRLDPQARQAAIVERTVSAELPDLGATFTGRLDPDGFHDMTTAAAPRAQIRLTLSSDDLVALADGSLSFGTAWSRGRLKVQASFGDLLRLRKLF